MTRAPLLREHRSLPFRGVELRDSANGTGGSTLSFTGYASVTETPYEMQDFLGPYSEVVRRGAFTKTLDEGADVAFKINHDGMTLARTKSGTLRLAEDSVGLLVSADLDPVSPKVQELRSGIDRGDLDEMSFAFMVTRQEWSPDYSQRDIQEVNLTKGDVSVVNYGANPSTAIPGMSLRSSAMDMARTRRMVAPILRELREGKVLSAANLTALQNILSHLATADAAIDPLVSAMTDADDALDMAQKGLSEILGVANPDPPDEGDMETEPGSMMQQNAAKTLQLVRAMQAADADLSLHR